MTQLIGFIFGRGKNVGNCENAGNQDFSVSNNVLNSLVRLDLVKAGIGVEKS